MNDTIQKIPLLTDTPKNEVGTIIEYYMEHSEVCPGEMADWARTYPEEAFEEGQQMNIALAALDLFEESQNED